jgi:hypothetical protein
MEGYMKTSNPVLLLSGPPEVFEYARAVVTVFFRERGEGKALYHCSAGSFQVDLLMKDSGEFRDNLIYPWRKDAVRIKPLPRDHVLIKISTRRVAGVRVQVHAWAVIPDFIREK